MGVYIRQYLADNHPFRAKEWTEDCANQHQQETRYSGVGAHHQNLAERYIQTIFDHARAMMIHFVLNWPQMARNQEHLWPFAVDYAVFMHNHLPSKHINNFAPIELFQCGCFSNYDHLTQAHTF